MTEKDIQDLKERCHTLSSVVTRYSYAAGLLANVLVGGDALIQAGPDVLLAAVEVVVAETDVTKARLAGSNDAARLADVLATARKRLSDAIRVHGDLISSAL